MMFKAELYFKNAPMEYAIIGASTTEQAWDTINCKFGGRINKCSLAKINSFGNIAFIPYDAWDAIEVEE